MCVPSARADERHVVMQVEEEQGQRRSAARRMPCSLSRSGEVWVAAEKSCLSFSVGHLHTLVTHPPGRYTDENVCGPWVPHTAHKCLTPGHPVGRTPPQSEESPENCLCLCAFFFPECFHLNVLFNPVSARTKRVSTKGVSMIRAISTKIS